MPGMSSRAPWFYWDRRQHALEQLPEAPASDRRSGRDRRKSTRVRLSLEIAVPVLVQSDLGLQRGLARNLSEGGMLIELTELPPIGTRLEITFAGVKGSHDAPEPVVLRGEVRHQLAWQYGRGGPDQTLRGVGVRFVEEGEGEDALSLDSWVFATGPTVH